MSGPSNTTSISQVNDILQKHIQCVRQTIDRQQTAETLIVDALTSAHRAQSNDYASNGNRELAGVGQTALAACIYFGRNSERTEFSKPARAEGSWTKLSNNQGPLQIASRSPLRHCLIPSIRQHGALSSLPASKRVVAFFVRSLIGVVYLDSGRDLEATSHTLIALCRFLDSDQSPDHGPGLPSIISSSASSSHGSGTNSEELALEAQGLMASGMSPLLDSELLSQLASNSRVDYADIDFQWDTLNPSCLQPQSRSDSDSLDANSARPQLAGANCSQHISNAAIPGCASDVLSEDPGFGMQKLSLAHASEGKQKSFVVTPPHAIEAPAESCRTSPHSSPIIPTPTPSRTTPHASTTDIHPKRPRATEPRKKNHQKLDDYVSNQLRRVESTWPVSPVDGAQILPAIHQSFIAPHEAQKSQVTMRRLHLGTASSFVISVIKAAIRAHRSATPSENGVQSRNPSHTDSSSYHYHEVVRLRSQRSQISIIALYHTYELYRTLSEGPASELDDGFVHDDQATASKRPKISGNPNKATISKLNPEMIAALEPGFDRKSVEEQALLKSDAKKLRLLGVRLHTLVRRFGLGVLCLMPFSNSVVDSESVIAITEAEFWNLPESSLIEMSNDMTPYNHPLALFSQAAYPILKLLVDKTTADTRQFRCEHTELVQIKDMVDGSSELLAQLEPM